MLRSKTGRRRPKPPPSRPRAPRNNIRRSGRAACSPPHSDLQSVTTWISSQREISDCMCALGMAAFLTRPNRCSRTRTVLFLSFDLFLSSGQFLVQELFLDFLGICLFLGSRTKISVLGLKTVLGPIISWSKNSSWAQEQTFGSLEMAWSEIYASTMQMREREFLQAPPMGLERLRFSFSFSFSDGTSPRRYP